MVSNDVVELPKRHFSCILRRVEKDQIICLGTAGKEFHTLALIVRQTIRAHWWYVDNIRMRSQFTYCSSGMERG